MVEIFFSRVENLFFRDENFYLESRIFLPSREFDPDGPVACIKTENMVSVPESTIQLTDNQADGIKCLVPDPLADDDNHRIRHCLAIANYLKLHY